MTESGSITPLWLGLVFSTFPTEMKGLFRFSKSKGGLMVESSAEILQLNLCVGTKTVTKCVLDQLIPNMEHVTMT